MSRHARERVPIRRRAAVFAALAALVFGGLVATPAVASADARASVSVSATSGVQVAVKTANLANFRAGNIMSDAVFFNKSTMSAAQIQAFLASKVPTCQSGYTCLKDKYDTTRTTAADAMCNAYSGGGSERASTIIFKVAQACGINPQVIIATLQKEQSLVTHTSPSATRYRIAMGQGCPDTAACDSRYYGFFNQVYGAAWQFKRYANPPGTSQYFTWYAPGKTWSVLYNPNRDCGSSSVLIQNQATANLYYYTPYQPNAAAIRAGYGTGDGCSSYGNRNFYNYFTDWFGSTQSLSIASIDTVASVFAIDGNDELWVYPRKGASTWYPRVSLAKGVTDIERLIGVGDLDGDGQRDIIGVGPAGEAWLYRGTYGVALKDRTRLDVDWSSAVLISAAHDFDLDGIPDVFITTSDGSLQLWRGNGAGGFRPPKVIGTVWGSMTMVVGVGDLTGDRRPDIVGRSSDGRLRLYTGDGRGGIAKSTVIGTGWNGMTAILGAGDSNGDGRADLLARDATGGLWGYTSTGTGIKSQGRVGTGWGQFSDVVGGGPAASGVRVFQPGAGDVDGDRLRDVLAVSSTGAVLNYRGNGKGGWLARVTSAQLPDTTSRLVTLGDFDGDGIGDLGRIAANGQFSLLSGTEAGGFTQGAVIGNGWAGMTMVFGGIDYDGDRLVDVIARDANGDLRLYRGTGAGTFQLGTGAVIGQRWGGMTAIFSAGDFTGDRNVDILARTTAGALLVYPTDGAGGMLPARQVGVGWQGMTSVFSPGNFDGAGGADVMARTADGRIVLYRGNGKGGWLGSAQIGTGWGGMAWIG